MKTKKFSFIEKAYYYSSENLFGLTDLAIKTGLVPKNRPFVKGARISEYGKYRFRKKYGKNINFD